MVHCMLTCWRLTTSREPKCGAYVSVRQIARNSSSAFPATVTVCFVHSHEQAKQPPRASVPLFEQQVTTLQRLEALPLSDMSVAQLVKYLNGKVVAGLARAALKSPFPDTPVLQCVWHAFEKVREMYHARLKTLLSRCKNGALPVSDDTRGNRRNYDFLGELTLAALRRIRDDLPDVFSAARQFALDEMTDAAECKQAINNILSRRFEREHDKQTAPTAPRSRSRKRKVAADAAAATASTNNTLIATSAPEQDLEDDEEDERTKIDAALGEFAGDDAGTPGTASLMHGFYGVVFSATEAEYATNLRAFKKAALMCGMAPWLYDYLLVGQLAPHRVRDIVYCYTNEWCSGDHTNNTAEQLHRLYGAGGLLEERRTLQGLVHLVDSLINFSHGWIVHNLAHAAGMTAASSAYATATRKTNALAKEIDDLRVVEASVTAAHELDALVVNGESKVAHTITLAPFVRCDCHTHAAKRDCRHVEFAVRKCAVPRPPFRANGLDDRHRALIKFVAVGTPVNVDELAPPIVLQPAPARPPALPLAGASSRTTPMNTLAKADSTRTSIAPTTRLSTTLSEISCSWRRRSWCSAASRRANFAPSERGRRRRRPAR
jgi:hypothetical protein